MDPGRVRPATAVTVTAAGAGRPSGVVSDVVGRQRVLPLMVMVIVMVIRVDGLVHVRVVGAAVLIERVTGVVVSGRRHPVQLGVQHVVDDGRRLPRPAVVLQPAADYGRVHHHRYGSRRLFDRVMVGPDGVLVGRHGVRRQHGAAFSPEPPEPIARFHGQLPDADTTAAAAPTAATATVVTTTTEPAATTDTTADAAATVPDVGRPTGSGVFGHGTVRAAAAGPPDDGAGAPVVQVVQVVHVVKMVQMMMVPRRYLGDLPLVMVQLLMVVMVMHSVRGWIERHQTFCEHKTKNYY